MLLWRQIDFWKWKVFFSCTVLLYKFMCTQHYFFDTHVRKWGLLYYFLILKSRRTITLVDIYIKSKRTDYFEYTASIVFSLEASWVQHSLLSKRLCWKLILTENWKVPNGLKTVPAWADADTKTLGENWCFQEVPDNLSVLGAAF